MQLRFSLFLCLLISVNVALRNNGAVLENMVLLLF